MTSTPPASPWPAPSLADLVRAGDAPVDLDAGPAAAHQHAAAAHARRSMATVLHTARRLSSRAERAEHAAAKMEERLGAELADLPAGWFVERGVDVCNSANTDDPDQSAPADHVVIGPGGIFLIFVEHQAGAKVWVSEHKVTVNGRDTERLGEVRYAARRAGEHLTRACGFDVTVQSVLVLIGAATVQTLSRPAEVHVRTQDDVRDWLCKQPTRLDVEMARAVHEHVRRGQPSPSYSLPGLLE